MEARRTSASQRRKTTAGRKQEIVRPNGVLAQQPSRDATHRSCRDWNEVIRVSAFAPYGLSSALSHFSRLSSVLVIVLRICPFLIFGVAFIFFLLAQIKHNNT
jgi:hypothetical protein